MDKRIEVDSYSVTIEQGCDEITATCYINGTDFLLIEGDVAELWTLVDKETNEYETTTDVAEYQPLVEKIMNILKTF